MNSSLSTGPFAKEFTELINSDETLSCGSATTRALSFYLLRAVVFYLVSKSELSSKFVAAYLTRAYS